MQKHRRRGESDAVGSEAQLLPPDPVKDTNRTGTLLQYWKYSWHYAMGILFI